MVEPPLPPSRKPHEGRSKQDPTSGTGRERPRLQDYSSAQVPRGSSFARMLGSAASWMRSSLRACTSGESLCLAAVRRLRQGDRVVPEATEACVPHNRVEGPVSAIDRHVEEDVAGSNQAGVFSQPQRAAGSYSRPTSRRSLQSTPRACPHRSSRSSSRSGRLATLPEWSVTQTWWPSGSDISTLSSLRFSRRQERSSAAGSSSATIVMLPDCGGIPAA
jgi:hypothetical protein